MSDEAISLEVAMKCIASGLNKKCPSCHGIMQSVCSKVGYKYESGIKSRMILVKFDEEVKIRKCLLIRSIETFESEESN